MKIRPFLPAALLALALLPACARHADCDCDSPPPAPSAAAPSGPAAAPTRHALRGVVVDILPAQQSLLVRHEAIPGYMAAMTMLFKVDAPTLAAARKDAPVTGELVSRNGELWLERAVFSPAP